MKKSAKKPEYMTVKEYAQHINRAVPTVYKHIREKKVTTETKFGIILIIVK